MTATRSLGRQTAWEGTEVPLARISEDYDINACKNRRANEWPGDICICAVDARGDSGSGGGGGTRRVGIRVCGAKCPVGGVCKEAITHVHSILKYVRERRPQSAGEGRDIQDEQTTSAAVLLHGGAVVEAQQQ